jgi:PhoH-like ATPase
LGAARGRCGVVLQRRYHSITAMSYRHRFSNSLTQENRFHARTDGFAGAKSGLLPFHSEKANRLHKRSNLGNAPKTTEKPQECTEGTTNKIIVLDTSVLVHDPESLEILRRNDCVLAIPWVVLEELDQLKHKPNIGWDAREVIKRIEELAQNEADWFSIEPKPSGKYFKSDLQKDKADHQIIATARALQVHHHGNTEVSVMSRDTIVRVLARELGIKADDYPYNQVNAAFHSCLKRINVPAEILSRRGDAFEHDCKNLEPMHQNEGVVCWSKLGGEWEESFAALFKGDHFRTIPSDIEALGLRPFSLESNGNGTAKDKSHGKDGRKNWSQYVALAQILDPEISLVFLQGGAGTGKTLIALAGALEQRKKYTNIVIARPMVHLEDRDEIGFLPGGLEQKMAPWMEPILHGFSFLGGLRPENGDLITRLQENKKIIMKPLDYIRGETYHKSFMIVDEAQNLTPHQVKTIITRAGSNAKMVFTGDLGQIDRNRRLDRKTSGLAYAMNKMANQSVVGIVNFKDTVRSSLASLAEELL